MIPSRLIPSCPGSVPDTNIGHLLPPGTPYYPAYFALLASHNVAHVFNAWTRMPEIGKQIAMEGAHTADFTVCRALLSRGRGYEDAVKTFEPYRRIQETNPGAREALAELGRRSWARKAPASLSVNNRLEGNAPGTIDAVTDLLAKEPGKSC